MEQSVAGGPSSSEQCISQHHMQNDGVVNSSGACFGKDPSEKCYPRRWTGWRGTDASSGKFDGDHLRRDKFQIPICRDNLRGSCARGASCKYQHSASNGHDGSRFYQNERENLGLGNSHSHREIYDNDARTRFSSKGYRCRSPCRRFQSGRCCRGASCPYLHPEWTGYDRLAHDVSVAQQQVDGAVRSPGFGEKIRDNSMRMSQRCDEVSTENNSRTLSFSGEHRSRSPCRNFLRGNCKFGALCKRWHPVNACGSTGHGLGTQCYQGVAEASRNPDCGEGSQHATLRTPQEHDQSNMHNHLRPGNFSREPRSRSPCQNYLSGKCYRGDSCVHLHPVTVYDRTRYVSWRAEQHEVSAASRNPHIGDGDITPTSRMSQAHEDIKNHAIRPFRDMHVINEQNRAWSMKDGVQSADNRENMDIMSISRSSERQRGRAAADFGGDKLVREVCLQFTRGRCNRGEFCRYLHGYHEYASSNWKKPRTESGCSDKETKGQSVCDAVERKNLDQKGDAPAIVGRKCEASGQPIANFCSSAEGHEDISLWSRPFKRSRDTTRSSFTHKYDFYSRNSRSFGSRIDEHRYRCYNVAQFQYPDRRSYKYDRSMHHANSQQPSEGELTSVNPRSQEHKGYKHVVSQHDEGVTQGLQLDQCPKGSFGSNVAIASKNEAESARSASKSSHTDQSDEELETDGTGVDSSDGAAAISQDVLESDSTSSSEEHHISAAAMGLTTLEQQGNIEVTTDLGQESNKITAELMPNTETNSRKKRKRRRPRSVSGEETMKEEDNDASKQECPTSSLVDTSSSNPNIEKKRMKRRKRHPGAVSCEESMIEGVTNASKQGMPSSSLAEDYLSNPNNDLESALMCDDSVKLQKTKKHKKKRPGPISCEETMKDGVTNVPKQGMQISSLIETSSSDPNRSLTNIIVNSVESALATTEVGTLLDGNADSHSLQASSKAVPMCRKKLLILDVNGLLADIVVLYTKRFTPDITVSGKGVFKRPFCDDFLQFCFENFDVGIWSSRNKNNVNKVVDFLLGDTRKRLLFCWDQSHCTQTGYKTLENKDKPLVLKELKKLWDNKGKCLPWHKGYYNETNTVLLDDSPYKALRNPPHTAVFPHPYHFKNLEDQALGPCGSLRKYLERLSKAENVQEFIKENPFGQRPITESNLSWTFYAKIVGTCTRKEAEKANVTRDS